MGGLIPGPYCMHLIIYLARDSTNCVLFTGKLCMTRLNRSIIHSRLVRSKKQLRRDIFITILINVQHESLRCNTFVLYEVIMDFIPIQNLLFMIRRFRLLASYYDWKLFGGYECSWH